MTLGENIKKIRELRGLSVQQLAEKMAVGRANIYNWESNDNSPSQESLAALAKSLDVTVDDLLNLNHTPVEKPGDNNGKPAPEIYRWLEDRDYTMVPKSIIDVLRKDIDANSKKFQDIIDSKNEFIEDLKSQLADLRAGRVVVVPPQQQT